MNRIDTSDAATGLPPLDSISGSDRIALVVAGTSGGQSIVTIPGTTDEHIAVKYLHLRGMLLAPRDSEDDEPVWVQRTLAIPIEVVPAVIAALKSA